MRYETRSPVRDVTRLWWVLLATGIAWLIIGLVVLRFDETSLATVGALLGAVLLVAGANELFMAYIRRSWAWAHALLGVFFIIGGAMAFFQPFSAFWALASILGFLLAFQGSFDLIGGFMARDVNDAWWLGVIVGVAELLLAFWVSQQFFEPRAILILVWVAFAAFFRGITQIVAAFHLRSLDLAVARIDESLDAAA